MKWMRKSLIIREMASTQRRSTAVAMIPINTRVTLCLAAVEKSRGDALDWIGRRSLWQRYDRGCF